MIKSSPIPFCFSLPSSPTSQPQLPFSQTDLTNAFLMSGSRHGIIPAAPGALTPRSKITKLSSQSMQGLASQHAAEKCKRSLEIPESDIEAVEPPHPKKVSSSQTCAERRK